MLEPAAPAVEGFAADVRRGLGGPVKKLAPLYFYDELGSALFEAICRLPWYPIYRAECALLDRAAAEITARLTPGADWIELGPGSGEKLLRLVAPMRARGGPRAVHLVDVSPAALDDAARRLGGVEGLAVNTYAATFEDGLAAAAGASRGARRLVLLLGSNLGNFERDEAVAFLGAVRARLRAGDELLLSVDLVKPAAVLERAYDDPLGVTAAFNKNLLARMNRELGANFDPAAFDHRALWNAAAGRVEMHLVSRVAQRVAIPGAGLEVAFEAGEGIWTESSHKYTPEGLDAMLAEAGFSPVARWREERDAFLTALYAAAETPPAP